MVHAAAQPPKSTVQSSAAPMQRTATRHLTVFTQMKTANTLRSHGRMIALTHLHLVIGCQILWSRRTVSPVSCKDIWVRRSSGGRLRNGLEIGARTGLSRPRIWWCRRETWISRVRQWSMHANLMAVMAINRAVAGMQDSVDSAAGNSVS